MGWTPHDILSSSFCCLEQIKAGKHWNILGEFFEQFCPNVLHLSLWVDITFT